MRKVKKHPHGEGLVAQQHVQEGGGGEPHTAKGPWPNSMCGKEEEWKEEEEEWENRAGGRAPLLALLCSNIVADC